MYKDGLELWKVFHEYVEAYIYLFYENEQSLLDDQEMQDYWQDYTVHRHANGKQTLGALSRISLIVHLTHSFFWVCGMHTFFGTVAEYLMDPSVMPILLPLYSSSEVPMNTINGAYLGAALMGLTNLAKPMLLNDFKHLHECHSDDKREKVHAIMDKWQESLKKLSVDIGQRNKSRKKIFDKMDPALILSSVSV